MDRARLDFLFGPGGTVDPVRDLDDVDLEPGGGERDERRREVGRRLIGMIERDDPPEVWATARRLLDLGLDRRDVLAQLRLVVRRRVLDLPDRLDDAGLVAALAALPVPTAAQITDAYLAEAAARPGGLVDDIENGVRARFGREPLGGGSIRDGDGDPFEWLLDVVADLPVDGDSPLEWLPGSRMVHVPSVTEGIVLTHRPDGWLDGFASGTVLAVTVAGDGRVTIGSCDEPAVDGALVGRLRAVYDQEVDEPWLSVSGEELVLGLLVDDPATFSQPRAPLSELAEAAGLERRGARVAHDDSVWRQDDSFARLYRFKGRLGEQRAYLACRVFDSVYGEAEYRRGDGPQGDEAARLALTNPGLGVAALDEAVPVDDPAAPDLEAAARWADRLVALAGDPHELAVARWLAALVAERAGDVPAAAAHLDLAVEADPDFGAAVDRAGWYASDRGDAALAVRLWRRLDRPERAELDEVESAARAAARTPGRNEPCWCGSGRKYKTCHLPQPAALPLPERVGWLCRKAVSFLERRSGEATEDVIVAAEARAVNPDDPDDLEVALADPIVMDAVLTEGGWFERFLAERGPLLPDDEALLGSAWLHVLRTVYEVDSVHPGDGMTVRDLRSGERIDVRERTFSRTAQPGLRFCGRAVPDGAGHQLVGAVFPVRPGEEAELLDLCDDADPFELCAWVGDLHRPPLLTTREGEPLVECRTVVEVPDPDQLAEVFDVRYEPIEGHSDVWAEMQELDPGDEILRAVLTLDRAKGRLTIETHSEARLDRVLATLEDAGWDIDAVEETRRPLESGEIPRPPQALPGLASAGGTSSGLGVDPQIVAQIQDQMEQRWLDESVPALGGVTPREAAGDPTRREALTRLIDSFPEPEPRSGLFTFRPDRLRKLLGLQAR